MYIRMTKKMQSRRPVSAQRADLVRRKPAAGLGVGPACTAISRCDATSSRGDRGGAAGAFDVVLCHHLEAIIKAAYCRTHKGNQNRFSRR